MPARVDYVRPGRTWPGVLAAAVDPATGITQWSATLGCLPEPRRLIAQAWARTEDFRDFTSVENALRSTPHRGVNGAYFFESPGQTALGYADHRRPCSTTFASAVRALCTTYPYGRSTRPARCSDSGGRCSLDRTSA